MSEKRSDDIAHRRTALTGVNEYPNLAEMPLPHADPNPGVQRYAAGFEALRDRSDAYLAEHGSRPTALLLPLGPLSEHNIRTTFAANLLASGGVETVNPGPWMRRGWRRRLSDAGVAAVRDLRHRRPIRAEASDVVDAARAAGVRTSIWPDRRRRSPSARRRLDAADKPDEYLTAKIDAIAALSTLLTRLGA